MLDGRLDEPVWRDAPVLKLVQQSPRPGELTSYETEVRIVVSKDRLYFGFICKDPNPSRIAVHTMRRDDRSASFSILTVITAQVTSSRSTLPEPVPMA